MTLEPVFYTVMALPVTLWACDHIRLMTKRSPWWERIGYTLAAAGLIGDVLEWWGWFKADEHSARLLFVLGLAILATGWLWRRGVRS